MAHGPEEQGRETAVPALGANLQGVQGSWGSAACGAWVPTRAGAWTGEA